MGDVWSRVMEECRVSEVRMSEVEWSGEGVKWECEGA
jgi:hypothetical protein